jgi:hypothetical protein
MSDLGLVADAWQERVLASNAPRIALACGRQVGKSTTTAVLTAHQLLYRPGSLSLVIAPSQRQSVERLRSVSEMLHRLGVESAIAEDDVDATATKIETSTGARAIALPGSGDTIRGYASVDLILLEEAAAIPASLLAACRPMLAVSKGRCIALSTPAGKGSNWFWRAWNDEMGAWEKYHVPSTECPRISPEFLAEELTAMGPLAYRQEYLAEFVDELEGVFTSAQIARALDCQEQPISL